MITQAARFDDPDRFFPGAVTSDLTATDHVLMTALQRWLKAVTGGMEVIFANQDGPRPPLPYLMVNLLGDRAIRIHEQAVEYFADPAGTSNPPPNPSQGPLPDVIARSLIEREWHFSIHSFGPYPTQVLRRLDAASRLAQITEPLFPSVTIHELSRIRDVPEYVNEKWEERANVDMFLRAVTRDEFAINVIGVTQPTEFHSI